ncbi:uncharacterized protein BCR38DRAFT_404445 [Pseudomassariella vexata]|uniref:Clr5 domain-containing protein n=1 Tax=Pseudomassariella vexata TaxID=1141098 RepID=A0A1Y2EIF2_9PEZI|nr:uncharacterized protein BCR38DRAFT_404445 [Pseudomassariella vexata]ORY71350.1 hypothetical protein BCR38DRAFT_404445 [Pseudomassariella vexata]
MADLPGRLGKLPSPFALHSAHASHWDNLERAPVVQPHAEPVRHTRQHSAEEWEAMYPLIKRLYVTEHRRLCEVMDIMEQKHGFIATKQMYKKRFTAWSLYKNYRQFSETKSDKQRVGRGSRSSVSSAKDRRSRGSNAHPIHIPAKPFGDGPAEGIITSLVEWTSAQLAGTQWHNGVVDVKPPQIYPSSRCYRDFSLASALWKRGNGHLAGMAVRKAFRRVEDIRDFDPGIIRNIVDIILDMLQSKQTLLIRMLLVHYAKLSSRMLPRGHPLARFFQYLALSEGNLINTLKHTTFCFGHIANRRTRLEQKWLYEQWAWDTSILDMDTELGTDHFRLKEVLRLLMYKVRPKEVEGKFPRTHLNMCKDTSLMWDFSVGQNWPGELLSTIAGQTCAPTEGSTATTYTQSTMDEMSEAYVQIYARKAKAQQAFDEGDWASAEASMTSAIRILETVHGDMSPRVIRELWSLEKVLRKAGQARKAETVGRVAISRVEEYLSDIEQVEVPTAVRPAAVAKAQPIPVENECEYEVRTNCSAR